MHALLRQLAFGRLHNSGAGAFGALPTVVESFMDGCVGLGRQPAQQSINKHM